METITISKAEMKAIPEPFSYNLFLLLDIALLSMFLFIHIFPFLIIFPHLHCSRIQKKNFVWKMEQLDFDFFHGLIKLNDFQDSRQNSIPQTTVASS
jgi:hypothetical protein